MIRFKDAAVKGRTKPKRELAAAPAGGEPPPKAPVVVAVSGAGPRFVPVTISLDQGMISRLDDWAHERRLTRSAGIRALLEEGLKR